VTEMHLKVIDGKPLYVGLAEKREVRQERLRSRYNVPKGGMPDTKGKGKGGKGKGGMGGGMNPMGMGMGAPPMFGQPMMGMQGMMGPRPAGGMMMPPSAMMMGVKGGMGPRGPMMGGPQMMAMMKGMPPQMMGKGMMPMPGMARPPMPGVQGGKGPMPVMMQGPPPTPSNAPLNASVLANSPPAVQKQMIGEKLFPAITRIQPELAGKITGMMLEMDNSELLMLLESDAQLKLKVDEALRVLETTK